MKITGVRTQPYQIKMKRPIGDANNPIGRDVMTPTALWLDTDEGISGISMARAGGGLEDVIRTRMYVTDMDQWAEIARAHQEAFGEVMPATSMVEVSRLIDPRMLVEIEADAIVAK